MRFRSRVWVGAVPGRLHYVATNSSMRAAKLIRTRVLLLDIKGGFGLYSAVYPAMPAVLLLFPFFSLLYLFFSCSNCTKVTVVLRSPLLIDEAKKQNIALAKKKNRRKGGFAAFGVLEKCRNRFLFFS